MSVLDERLDKLPSMQSALTLKIGFDCYWVVNEELMVPGMTSACIKVQTCMSEPSHSEVYYVICIFSLLKKTI